MKRLGFLSFILSFVFCAAIGCDRSGSTSASTSPSTKETLAFAATVVGTYEHKNDAAHTPLLPPPTVTLSPDGTFTMTSIPEEWIRGQTATPQKTFSMKGRWHAGDDGDGSWEIVADVSDAGGIITKMSLKLSPFTQGGVGVLLEGGNPLYRIPN